MLLKAFRNGMGYLIVGADLLSRPRKRARSAEKQLQAQNSVRDFSLYQLKACPFCVKTRRAIHKLNVDIPIRDIGKNTQFREELQAGGGRIKVPCLRIDNSDKTEWIYESNAIISFLEQRIGA